jgi:hypothetical protein
LSTAAILSFWIGVAAFGLVAAAVVAAAAAAPFAEAHTSLDVVAADFEIWYVCCLRSTVAAAAAVVGVVGVVVVVVAAAAADAARSCNQVEVDDVGAAGSP